MKTSSELLLTFLLNACWQIPVITLAAIVGNSLLKRSPVRFQHRLWVSALVLSLVIPLIATWRFAANEVQVVATDLITAIQSEDSAALTVALQPATLSSFSQTTRAIFLDRTFAQLIIALYLGVLLFGVFRFAKACLATRAIRREARPVVVSHALAAAITKCQKSIGTQSPQILCSDSLPVPVTLGVLKPVIILPEQLVREGNIDLLTSAIAHEFIHVLRRDYILNLAYELIYLALSFNPAASILRRRIKRTRELSCDELVADQVLAPDVYARSLVTIASAAPPVGRLSITATVGIADADILEVRVMSLMNKSKLYPRSRKLALLGVGLLLVASSVTAMAFSLQFDLQPPSSAITQDQESKQKEKEKEKVKEGIRSQEFLDGMRAGQKGAELKRRHLSGDDSDRLEVELKARHAMHAELVRLARIPMDQAIQIATSQFPGNVLHSSLGATRWENVGELAKDGQVFYHVIVLRDDNSTLTHVWVNAIDGTITKSEKELPRKQRSAQPEQ